MKRLSIIIPMFKVEAYVERCLRSLEDQDIESGDYEIICVNDGSPDGSRDVVAQLQDEFDNIVLLNQENQGVSEARNRGIDLAKGKYLLFIDPDDYVESNCFSRMLDRADENDAQVVFLGFSIVNENADISTRIFSEKYAENIYRGIDTYFLSRGDGRTDPDRMWAVLYSNELFSEYNLRFLPNVPYLEDGELITRVLCVADRCIFDGHSFYLRTTRQGSATHSNLFNSKQAISGFIRSAVKLRDFKCSTHLTHPQQEFINQPIVKFVVLSISATVKRSKMRLLFETSSLLKQNNLKSLDLRGCEKLYKRYGTLYNTSVYLLYLYLCLRAILKSLIFFLSKQLNYRNQ